MRRFEWAAMIGLSMASLLVTAVPTPADGGTAQGSGSTTSGGSFTQSQSGSTSGRTGSEKESGTAAGASASANGENEANEVTGRSEAFGAKSFCGSSTGGGSPDRTDGKRHQRKKISAIVGAIVGSLVPVVFSK
jgi:hypothetical protein